MNLYTSSSGASWGRKFQRGKGPTKERVCLQNACRATNQCNAQTEFCVNQPSDVASGGVLAVASFVSMVGMSCAVV